MLPASSQASFRSVVVTCFIAGTTKVKKNVVSAVTFIMLHTANTDEVYLHLLIECLIFFVKLLKILREKTQM